MPTIAVRYRPISVRATPPNLILNQTAVTALGFASPADAIGKTIIGMGGDGVGPAQIVGVVADQRLTSPREKVRPTAFIYTTGEIMDPFAVVRFIGRSGPEMLAALGTAWRDVAPAVPFEARTATENLYLRYYKQDSQRARLFTIGALLAVLIGCIGLYGLAAFDTARRVKEIGIRKVLGASTGDVLKLLLARFMRPVIAANLIAWPLAYFAMRRWLAGFDDRIALSPWFFVLAGAGAAIIAALTIFGQSWRVARAEPARALSYE